MQGNRGGGDPFFNFGDPFAGLGGFSGFAGQRSLASSFFGGRDPFDDPFFTRPFGGLFEPSIFAILGILLQMHMHLDILSIKSPGLIDLGGQ